MKILCNEKDFYDYVSLASDDVVFDRRRKACLTKEDETIIFKTVIENSYSPIGFLGVFFGHTLYIYKIEEHTKDGKLRQSRRSTTEKYEYVIELMATKHLYDFNNEAPIIFYSIDLPFTIRFRPYFKKEKDYTEAIINEIENGNPKNWKFKQIDVGQGYPILKNTFLAALNPFDVHHSIESWLISKHNDKDCESEGLTDLDKIENHGFDKKSSFRNLKS